VLGLYGAEDQGIPVDQVKQMETALKAAGKTTEFKVYPSALFAGLGGLPDFSETVQFASPRSPLIPPALQFCRHGHVICPR
jgi:dienelactone hydrolase